MSWKVKERKTTVEEEKESLRKALSEAIKAADHAYSQGEQNFAFDMGCYSTNLIKSIKALDNIPDQECCVEEYDPVRMPDGGWETKNSAIRLQDGTRIELSVS